MFCAMAMLRHAKKSPPGGLPVGPHADRLLRPCTVKKLFLVDEVLGLTPLLFRAHLFLLILVENAY